MEPVGLAVGVVGLAGLFSTCLEAIQRFDSYQNFGRDSRSLAAQFNSDKHRLENWGQAVGIEQGKLSDTHHPALDDPQSFSVVHQLLLSIQDFCSGADCASYQQPTLADSKASEDASLYMRQAQPRQGVHTESRWRKVAWALSGKTKRTSHVQTFAILVQCLYDVVPADGAKSTLSGYGARICNDARPLGSYKQYLIAPAASTQRYEDVSANEGSRPVEILAFLRKAEEEIGGNGSLRRRLRLSS